MYLGANYQVGDISYFVVSMINDMSGGPVLGLGQAYYNGEFIYMWLDRYGKPAKFLS